MLTLNDLKISEKGKVIDVGSFGSIRRRLIDMGITPGTIITIKKFAPTGDPVEINLRGYNLSLRKQEAEQVTVEKIN